MDQNEDENMSAVDSDEEEDDGDGDGNDDVDGAVVGVTPGSSSAAEALLCLCNLSYCS
jgi:hypothetical protein